MDDADDTDLVRLPGRVTDLLDREPGDEPEQGDGDDPDRELDFDLLHLQRWGTDVQEEQ